MPPQLIKVGSNINHRATAAYLVRIAIFLRVRRGRWKLTDVVPDGIANALVETGHAGVSARSPARVDARSTKRGKPGICRKYVQSLVSSERSAPATLEA